jgi:hypothetical protein
LAAGYVPTFFFRGVSVSEIDKQVGLSEGKSVIVILDTHGGSGHDVTVAFFTLYFYFGTSGGTVYSEEGRVVQELSLLCVFHTYQMVGDKGKTAIAYDYWV